MDELGQTSVGLRQGLDEVDRVEKALAGHERRLRKTIAFFVVVAGAAGATALPGGIGYALTWAGGFLAAGGLVSIPTLRELQARRRERERLLAGARGDRPGEDLTRPDP
jgi:hypothetical protein